MTNAEGRATTTDDLGSLRYVDALAELEQILAELERETVDVDRLAERVRRASALIGHCRARIGSARLEVETIVASLAEAPGGPEPAAGGGRASRIDEPF